MARKVTNTRRVGMTVLAWLVGFLIFFPILWTVLTSFKTEADAYRDPAEVPVLPLDDGELRRGAGAQRLFRPRLNSILLSSAATSSA